MRFVKMEAEKLKQLHELSQEKWQSDAEIRAQLQQARQECEQLEAKAAHQEQQQHAVIEELKLEADQLKTRSEMALQKKEQEVARVRAELKQELILARDELSRQRTVSGTELSELRKAMAELESSHTSALEAQSSALWNEKMLLQTNLCDLSVKLSQFEMEKSRAIQEIQSAHAATVSELMSNCEIAKEQAVAAETENIRIVAELEEEQWASEQQLRTDLRTSQNERDEAVANGSKQLSQYKTGFHGLGLKMENAANKLASEFQIHLTQTERKCEELEANVKALEADVELLIVEMNKTKHTAQTTEQLLQQQLDLTKSAAEDARKQCTRIEEDKQRQLDELRPLASKIQAQLQSVIDERDARIVLLENEKQAQWTSLKDTLELTETEARSTLESERRFV